MPPLPTVVVALAAAAAVLAAPARLVPDEAHGRLARDLSAAQREARAHVVAGTAHGEFAALPSAGSPVPREAVETHSSYVVPAAAARDREAVETHVRNAMLVTSAPGAAAVVTRGGAVVFEGYFGTAAPGRAAAASTLWSAGAVSRLAVSVAALQCWERGDLDLDAPLGGYLPFPLPPHVTARAVLHHTSGLRDGTGLNTRNGSDPVGYAGRDAAAPMAAYLAEHCVEQGDFYSPVNYGPPGAHAQSHVAFSVLALAIEGTAFVDANFGTHARPFEAYVKTHVFAPLGVVDADVTYSVEAAPHRLAMAYGELPPPAFPDYAANGLRATATALAALGIALNGRGRYGASSIFADPATADMLLGVKVFNPLLTSAGVSYGIEASGRFSSDARERITLGVASDGFGSTAALQLIPYNAVAAGGRQQRTETEATPASGTEGGEDPVAAYEGEDAEDRARRLAAAALEADARVFEGIAAQEAREAAADGAHPLCVVVLANGGPAPGSPSAGSRLVRTVGALLLDVFQHETSE